jgi:hypothetical protein
MLTIKKKGGREGYMSYLPGIIDQYEKLFGITAIEKGFISSEDLIKALTIQAKENIKSNEQRFIREILLDQDIMSVKQITEVCNIVFHQQDRQICSHVHP